MLCSGFLSACSVLVYTPVVVSSTLGLNETDLSTDERYSPYIKRPFRLLSDTDGPWVLKKFEGGRYHIQHKAIKGGDREICDLADGRVEIEKVFEDSINGGIFYRASVQCLGHTYEAPLNRWFDSIIPAIEFIE